VNSLERHEDEQMTKSLSMVHYFATLWPAKGSVFSYLLLITAPFIDVNAFCSTESSTSNGKPEPVLDKEEILQAYIPNKLHMCICKRIFPRAAGLLQPLC